jgi:long-chain acyl-CoA synthetase
MVYYGSEISYGVFEDAINRFAAYLHGIGVRQGDNVVIMMYNCPQFMMAFFAVQKIGAVACPVNPAFRKLDLEFEINEMKARVIVANTCLHQLIQAVLPATSLETVILSPLEHYAADTSAYPFTVCDADSLPCEGTVSMMEALWNTAPAPPKTKVGMDDVGLILFTSGTTGLPKGAMLTHGNALYKCAATSDVSMRGENGVWIQTQPLCHIAGVNYANVAFYDGAAVVLMARHSAPSFCETVAARRCDSWYGTALMAKKIVDLPDIGDYDMRSLKFSVLSSFGLKSSEGLAEKWRQITCGGILTEGGYGLTESHTMDAIMPPDGVVWGSNGRAAYGEMGMKIMENGVEVPVGQMGEIALKNKGIFKGYLNHPEATARILRDGWLYTGDLGCMDENAYLYFMGRRKDMMKIHGFSVFPDEVEMYLNMHPAIEKSAVVGKTADEPAARRPGGQMPKRAAGRTQKKEPRLILKAFVVLHEAYKGKISAADILEWAAENMASYKCPCELEFLACLPCTETGKIQRELLRARENGGAAEWSKI